jgi:hypothetical protein
MPYASNRWLRMYSHILLAVDGSEFSKGVRCWRIHKAEF